jgi:hypothetical protein
VTEQRLLTLDKKVFRKMLAQKVDARTVECGTFGRTQLGMSRFVKSLAVNQYRHFRCGETRNMHKVLLKRP